MTEDGNTEERAMAHFFDRCFDEGLFLDFEPGERDSTVRILEMIGIEKGWRIIEPGCGCGRFTRLLAERIGPEGAIEACDLSPRMLDYCRENKYAPWVRFYNLPVRDLDLPPHSIDCILCFNVWPHFTRTDSILERFVEFLKPSGSLVIAHSRGRDFINSIHRESSEEMITRHMLPAARDLAGSLEKRGWEPVLIADERDLYVLKCVRRFPAGSP